MVVISCAIGFRIKKQHFGRKNKGGSPTKELEIMLMNDLKSFNEPEFGDYSSNASIIVTLDFSRGLQ
jgi:hypothetical protein